MSKIYITVAGDTFSSVSIKEFGVEWNAVKIVEANPGVVEPFQPGTQLTIPDDPFFADPFETAQTTTTEDKNAVQIFINGKHFTQWHKISISRSLDSFSTIALSAPFDPEDLEFKAAFRPFKYDPIKIRIGGRLIFTGVIVEITPQLSDSNTVEVKAYSKPGVLNDCTAPASAAPLEFGDMNLEQIARQICAPFGIAVNFLFDAGGAFDPPVALEPGDKVLSFLSKLAKQKGLIISDNNNGGLIFHKSQENLLPVATLIQGQPPLVNVTPSFKAQEYYSEITGIEETFEYLDAEPYTEPNPKLKGVVRPLTFKITDSNAGDIEQAVKGKIGRMFGNIAKYNVVLSTWRDENGDLWEPNNAITLLAPRAMVYNAYNFIIRAVRFERTENKEVALLELVLPGCYSGQIPEALPWEN